MTTGAVPDLRAFAEPIIRRNPWLLWIVIIVVGALVFGVPSLAVVQLGAAPYEAINRSYPGLQTSLYSSLLRGVVDAAACVALGAVVHQVLVRATPGSARLRVDGDIEMRVMQVASFIWMLGAGTLVAVDAADSNGLPLLRVTMPGAMAFLLDSEDLPKAWIVSAIAAAVVYAISVFARRWSTLLIALWLAALGVLAPVAVGQILVGRDHDFGSDAGAIASLAQTGLLGVLVVVAIRIVSGRLVRPESLRRVAILATIAMPVWLSSEIVVLFFKLAAPGAWATPTAAILLARIAVIVVILLILLRLLRAHRHRRLDDRLLSRGFGGLVVAAASVISLSVVMVRIPPPHYFVEMTIMDVLLGFPVTTEPTLDVLATGWRVNLLFACIAAGAISVYLMCLQRLRRRGDSWPLGRTISWLLGWSVVVLATSSGFGRYSAADFAIHMGVHMALNMLAPMLLVMGGVVTLLLRATQAQPRSGTAGPHEWITAALHSRLLRTVYQPVLVFVLFVGSYYGLYLTDLFSEAVRQHWAHQVMNLHFVLVGYLYYGLVIGVDRPPRPLPHLGKLGFVLAAMPFHAFFGIIVMSSEVVIAETFYQYLDLPWANDLLATQYLGGGIAWAGGELPLLVVVIALVTQWARQDRREAARKDRHLDSGRDDDFDAYNEMLRRMAERRSRAAGEGSS